MILVLGALLFQDPAGDIESLVRDLGHELIEVRERAQRDLIRIGTAAIPALKAASHALDAEVRGRAWTALLRVDRTERERDHDSRAREDLVRSIPARFPYLKDISWSHLSDHAAIALSANSASEWTVLSMDFYNLLEQRDPASGRWGTLRLNTPQAESLSGRPLTTESCAVCSPRLLRIRNPGGPMKVRMTGTLTWYSRYELEFPSPRDGQSQEVGDMTVEVRWPRLMVRSKSGIRSHVLARRSPPRFDCDLKPGVALPKVLLRGGAAFEGGRCGAGTDTRRAGWCFCAGGASTRPPPAPEPPVHEFSLTVPAEGVRLEDVSRIRCALWKPHDIPIDFTVEVTPIGSAD